MESDILYSQTKSLKKSRKNEIIGRFKEVNFHKELQYLFQKQGGRLAPPVDLDTCICPENLYKMANFP